MEECPLPERYDDWPPEPERRAELALELLGQHLVDAYDGSVQMAANILFESYRYKSPTEEQRQLLEWIASLSEDERQKAFTFVRQQLDAVVFSVLLHLDGHTFRALKETVYEEFRLVVELHPRSEDGAFASDEEPVESVAIPGPPSGVELHERWPRWLKRYSRWPANQT